MVSFLKDTSVHKKTTVFILLCGIFLIAVFLRFFQLSSFPVGFQIDEASLGYNGYSLLLTGKDDGNHPWPLYVDMFGDNRPAGYHYLTMLPIKLFGLTEFATRVPGAFFGSISIFAIAFLVYILFKDIRLSLLSSVLLAFAPWHVVLSRASAEAIVSLFFIMVGFACIVLSVQTKRKLTLVLGTICVSLSFFFYHTPRVFVPLLFFVLLISSLWQFRKTKNRSFQVGLIGSFLFVSLLSFLLVFKVSGGTGRYSQVSIFTFPETKLVMEEQIREDGWLKVPLLETRLLHNKAVNYTFTFAKNYLEYFSGSFLFISGGLPIWYVVPNMGLIYLVELPFIVYGLYSLMKGGSQASLIIFLWILVSPITAAVTVDDIPNINRTIVLFPMLEICAAYGIYQIITRRRKLFFLVFICIIGFCFAFNIFYFLHQYFVQAKAHRTWYRSNGFPEMMDVVKQHYNTYDKIVMTKNGQGVYPLVLFFMRYDPRVYQQEGSPKDKEYKGFGKFIFVPQSCPSIDKNDLYPEALRTIYINAPGCKQIKNVSYTDIFKEDGTLAFRIQFVN